ncbi:MAG: hypothetical protein PUC65_06415, partial [Clostridiales bacterium]|nr:hypothetical protein [Clostridiales bacterium]
TNKTDRRMKRILITPKGYEVFGNCERTIGELNEFILTDWTEEEKKEILTLLDRIAEKLKPTRQC